MPIYFDDFAGKVRHVLVHWEDLEVNVSYDAAKNTGAWAIDLQRAAADGELPVSSAIEQLTRLLVGWDILQPRNGEEPDVGNPLGAPMLPITHDNLARLPLPFLTAILQQINEQQNPIRRKSGR